MYRVKYALRWFSELRPVSGNTPWSLSGHDPVTVTHTTLKLKASALKVINFKFLPLTPDSFVTFQVEKTATQKTVFYTHSNSGKPIKKLKNYFFILLVNISHQT